MDRGEVNTNRLNARQKNRGDTRMGANVGRLGSTFHALKWAQERWAKSMATLPGGHTQVGFHFWAHWSPNRISGHSTSSTATCVERTQPRTQHTSSSRGPIMVGFCSIQFRHSDDFTHILHFTLHKLISPKNERSTP